MTTESARPTAPPRLEPVTLEGRWVRLEPLAERHGDDLTVAAQSNRHIWDWMPMRAFSPPDVQRLIQLALDAQQNGLGLAFAVVDRATSRAVGSSRYLDYQPANRGVEIGWTWYHAAHQGSATNPES